jgi:hypothetical protein
MVSVQERINRNDRASATGVYRWLFGFVVALIITLGSLALSIYLTREQASFAHPYTPKPYDPTVQQPSEKDVESVSDPATPEPGPSRPGTK